MVAEYNSYKSIRSSRGKFCYFQKEDFYRHNLHPYYWKHISDINQEELRDKIVNILKKEGFVFFENEPIEYKVITRFGKLIEFAVNFRHIT